MGFVIKMSNLYQTTDTPEAAYLLLCGFKMKEMKFINEKQVTFFFDWSEKLEEEVQKFKRDENKHLAFLHNFKGLQAKIYTLKKQKWQSKSYHPKNQTYYGKWGNYLR
jgi:hypothetical protein